LIRPATDYSHAIFPATAYATGTASSLATQKARIASATAIPDAVSTSYPSYLPGHGTLAVNNPLIDNGEGVAAGTISACGFEVGAYHIKVLRPKTAFSCSPIIPSSFSNFIFEVQMTIINGDCGGATFRGDIFSQHYYSFNVCQNGSFDLHIDDPPTKILVSRFSSVIHKGLNQTNLIDVVANGDTITLYVNQQQIAPRVSDSTYNYGQLGFVANAISSTTEAVFSNAKVWIL